MNLSQRPAPDRGARTEAYIRILISGSGWVASTRAVSAANASIVKLFAAPSAAIAAALAALTAAS